MKFLLKPALGQAAVREVPAHLRIYGTRHHWLEKFLGEIFIHPGGEEDERIMKEQFTSMLQPIEDRCPLDKVCRR